MSLVQKAVRGDGHGNYTSYLACAKLVIWSWHKVGVHYSFLYNIIMNHHGLV